MFALTCLDDEKEQERARSKVGEGGKSFTKYRWKSKNGGEESTGIFFSMVVCLFAKRAFFSLFFFLSSPRPPKTAL